MERVRLKLRPSFLAFLTAATLFRRGFFALNYAVAVTLHELAHYYVASRRFYRCTEIRLSIFGAVLYGDFQDVTARDRIAIALAGPVCNMVLVVACLALWWIAPESYYYTEDFFTANLSMACINMLPCYPLDGGRALTGLFETKLGGKGLEHTKKLTAILSLAAFGIFVYSLFTGDNLFSLGLFAVFLFCGVFARGKECYVKTTLTQNGRFLKKGMEKKTLVFNADSCLRDVAKRMQGNYLYCLEVVDANMEVTSRYSVAELEKLVITTSLDAKLYELKKF